MLDPDPVIKLQLLKKTKTFFTSAVIFFNLCHQNPGSGTRFVSVSDPKSGSGSALKPMQIHDITKIAYGKLPIALKILPQLRFRGPKEKPEEVKSVDLIILQLVGSYPLRVHTARSETQPSQ
jgi:hypothetical protein